MKSLLDTNTVAYFFKGKGRVGDRLLQTHPSALCVSAVTVYELRVGIARSTQARKRQQQLDQLLSTIRVLGFGSVEADAAARRVRAARG